MILIVIRKINVTGRTPRQLIKIFERPIYFCVYRLPDNSTCIVTFICKLKSFFKVILYDKPLDRNS